MKSNFIQATIQNISAEKYKYFQTCFSDIAEQRDIINFLNDKTNKYKIGDLIKKIQSQIEKLKEYRQTLISNVVTGKVRIVLLSSRLRLKSLQQGERIFAISHQ